MKSKMFDKIKGWYEHGDWPIGWVRNAVIKGAITAEEYREITGLEYET